MSTSLLLAISTVAAGAVLFSANHGNKRFLRVFCPYIVGSNGIDGEMHLEPVGRATGYWAIGKMIPASETIGVITFSDSISLYHGDALHRSDTPEEFEFTATVERYDAFVADCRNGGKVVDIIQYLGVVTVEGTEYVATWHVHAESERGIPCNYPEIIRHSFGHDFGV